MKQHKSRWHFSRRTRKILLLAMAGVVSLFVITNAVLWGIYRDRTYPRTKVIGTAIGSVAYQGLSQKITNLQLLPENLELVHGQQKATVSLADLGITKDVERTTGSADKQRHWLPVVNLFKTPELQAPVSIDDAKLTRKLSELAKTLRQDSINAHLVVSNGTVSITDARDGYELQPTGMRQALLSSLDSGRKTVEVPVTVTKPRVQAGSLTAPKAELEAQLKTPLTYKYEGKSKQASTAEIAGWYVPSGETYVLSPEKVQAYISGTGTSFGIRVSNVVAAVNATQQALAKKQALSFALTHQAALKSFTYCVAARGVDASYLPGLKTKLKETYGSSRGWSADGRVEFKEVASGCNFTVWLTAANLMPTFGEICDSMWSCRVGPNVVINFDRWQNASPAWNQTGGSLDEYRHMVINHETGHWLSFGHSHCPGPGQPAPVMQQQSIDLQGCSFNAWPTAAEIAALRQKLGI